MTEGVSGSQRRDLWLPALVGLVGVLISLACWGLLVSSRRALVMESSAEIASQARNAVELQLERQLETLLGLGELWGEFGLRPLPEWRADADQRVDRIIGLRSVAWVDFDEPDDRIAAGAQGSPIEIDVEEALRHRDRAHIEGPLREASGSVGYRVFVPVRTPRDSAGVLVAHFEAQPLLEALLRGRAPGYALSLFWEDEKIFSRGDPSEDRWQRWWWLEQNVALPLGGSWRLVWRPTADLAAERLTPIPHYLLLTGVVLSLVLAVLAHQLRVIGRQSRFLAASNRALEERGAALESAVTERTEELEEAIRELETFNYSVSHDLRSPLGAILNFAAILEEDYRERPLDDDGMQLVARIRRSASRGTSLLEGLLRLSRAGRTALHLETVDMAQLARESFAQVRAAEDDGDAEFFLDPLPGAVGDRTLLRDVFANLFSNALKYSRCCEKRRISVSGRTEQAERIYEVADNGRGFDMRFADKLFGAFERLHPGGEIEGTGVGLAMVARIVKRHGGRVWAQGRPGEGARFGFSLPVRAAP